MTARMSLAMRRTLMPMTPICMSRPARWRNIAMPREFSVDARVSSFELPAHTKAQIKSQMQSLDTDARSVVITAIATFCYLVIGVPERYVGSDLDELKEWLDS